MTGKGKELARIGPGSCFGELALLNDNPRAANVMALTDSQVSTHKQDDFVCEALAAVVLSGGHLGIRVGCINLQ